MTGGEPEHEGTEADTLDDSFDLDPGPDRRGHVNGQESAFPGGKISLEKEQVSMSPRPWALCAVALSSATLACAVSGNADVTGGVARTRREPIAGIELVLVKGGCYPMGDVFGDGELEETPVHEVCVGDFFVGRYEVTRGQWKEVMGTAPSLDRGCTDEGCPVENVSWNDAQEFIRRLNAEGGRYRLPTEAEWEYAARSGGKKERYSGGDDVKRVAWYAENSGRRNHPVGTRAPNGLGIYDMSGNVWEWTNDWYGLDYYSRSPRDNPAGPSGPMGPDVDRVIRGGCKTGEAHNERTTRRSYGFQRTSSDRSDKVGFRLAATP
jgi:formylglycine-generating enzyme required for sulfatase activity